MSLKQVAAGVTCLRLGSSNVYFVGQTGKPWLLVDTGMAGKAPKIRAAAESLYGSAAPPARMPGNS